MSTEFWCDNFLKWGQRYWIIAIPMRNLALSLNTGWGKHCIPVMKRMQAFHSHMCTRWRSHSIQLCFSEGVPAHYQASKGKTPQIHLLLASCTVNQKALMVICGLALLLLTHFFTRQAHLPTARAAIVSLSSPDFNEEKRFLCIGLWKTLHAIP